MSYAGFSIGFGMGRMLDAIFVSLVGHAPSVAAQLLIYLVLAGVNGGLFVVCAKNRHSSYFMLFVFLEILFGCIASACLCEFGLTLARAVLAA